jgi:hypothetical protein
VQDPDLQAAVARMTIACTATDLGPALGTMLLRLFPHLFKVRIFPLLPLSDSFSSGLNTDVEGMA